MKAALLYGKEDLRIEEMPIPIIADDEILLRVRSAAICGSDLRMVRYGYNGVDDDHPLILGHEISGTIEKIGNRVSGYSEGMRVAVAPNIGCGLCDWCVSGNTHLCEQYQALGINLHGGFAEYVRIPEKAILQGNVTVLDNHVSYDEAAVNEPLSCVYNGFTQYKVYPGDRVLIIGAGPIGIMHAKLAKMAGAAKVMITDLSSERLDICRQIDDFFTTVPSDGLNQRIIDITEGHGLNVCVTACPAPSAQAQALELMAIGGRVNFFGGLPKERENTTLNTNLIHYRQLIITGSTRASISQYRKTLSFITSGILEVKSLITGRFTLDRIEDALALATDAKGLKNVIVFE
jgi:L-iditol 2-dehydrogenase